MLSRRSIQITSCHVEVVMPVSQVSGARQLHWETKTCSLCLCYLEGLGRGRQSIRVVGIVGVVGVVGVAGVRHRWFRAERDMLYGRVREAKMKIEVKMMMATSIVRYWTMEIQVILDRARCALSMGE